MKALLALSLLAVFAILAAGCGDDESNGDSETPAATVESTPEPARRTESIAALTAYLAEEGLDGSVGALTDPVECPDSAANGIEGDFCILQTSLFAPALALILVADVDEPSERAWQVRVVLENGLWHVTEVVRFGPE